MNEDEVDFYPHSLKQNDAVLCKKKVMALCTGIQWGKTQTGAIRMKVKMHAYTDAEDNFIIAAPNYKILQQSTLPAFLKIMDGLGVYNKVEACFRMHGGGTCYMRTATEPDSIVGIRNVRHIWIDEAGKVSLYFWENTVARSAFRDCQIDLTSSPYSFNWLYKEIVRPKMKDPLKLPNVELIQAASWENPYFPPATIEHAKQTMDPRRFGALFGGLWEKQVGLVYDCFDENENMCEIFDLPTGTRFVAGIDWGFSHPFAMVIRAITPSNLHLQVGEIYKTGLTISQIVEICRQKKSIFNIEKFYCDPAQPAHIEELCRHGCPAVAADNSVQVGIDRHYELIKSRKYKMFRGTSPFTLDEYETYHYAESEDQHPDKDGKDRGPVKQDDHACFVAGTLIRSLGQDVPIELLRIGDFVDTPCGPMPIEDIIKTENMNVVRANFSNGASLVGTVSHKIYKPFHGFIPLLEWTEGDILPSWGTNNLSSLTAKSIGFMVAITNVGALFCTEIFTNSMLEKSLRDMTSIIKTFVARTIQLKIWLQCQGQTIRDFMPAYCLTNRKTQGANTSLVSTIWQNHGTLAKQENYGTARTESALPPTENISNLNAKIAARHLRIKMLSLSFARMLVNRALDAKAALIMLKSCVVSVLNRLFGTNMLKPELVRLNALVNCSERQSVYNIQVAKYGSYFANGFFVANCDANRYVTIMTYTGNAKIRPKNPEERQKKKDPFGNDWMKKEPFYAQTEKWS